MPDGGHQELRAGNAEASRMPRHRGPAQHRPAGAGHAQGLRERLLS